MQDDTPVIPAQTKEKPAEQAPSVDLVRTVLEKNKKKLQPYWDAMQQTNDPRILIQNVQFVMNTAINSVITAAKESPETYKKRELDGANGVAQIVATLPAMLGEMPEKTQTQLLEIRDLTEHLTYPTDTASQIKGYLKYLPLKRPEESKQEQTDTNFLNAKPLSGAQPKKLPRLIELLSNDHTKEPLYKQFKLRYAIAKIKRIIKKNGKKMVRNLNDIKEPRHSIPVPAGVKTILQTDNTGSSENSLNRYDTWRTHFSKNPENIDRLLREGDNNTIAFLNQIVCLSKVKEALSEQQQNKWQEKINYISAIISLEERLEEIKYQSEEKSRTTEQLQTTIAAIKTDINYLYSQPLSTVAHARLKPLPTKLTEMENQLHREELCLLVNQSELPSAIKDFFIGKLNNWAQDSSIPSPTHDHMSDLLKALETDCQAGAKNSWAHVTQLVDSSPPPVSLFPLLNGLHQIKIQPSLQETSDKTPLPKTGISKEQEKIASSVEGNPVTTPSLARST